MSKQTSCWHVMWYHIVEKAQYLGQCNYLIHLQVFLRLYADAYHWNVVLLLHCNTVHKDKLFPWSMRCWNVLYLTNAYSLYLYNCFHTYCRVICSLASKCFNNLCAELFCPCSKTVLFSACRVELPVPWLKMFQQFIYRVILAPNLFNTFSAKLSNPCSKIFQQ